MQQMVDNAMDSSSGYGQQRSEAWHYMFGREPNYSAAYAAAIKAVESIALPMVEPNNKDSTEQGVTGHVGSTLGIPDRGAGRKQCSWRCHPILMSGLMNSSRPHGGPDSGVVSKEKAQAAVLFRSVSNPMLQSRSCAEPAI